MNRSFPRRAGLLLAALSFLAACSSPGAGASSGGAASEAPMASHEAMASTNPSASEEPMSTAAVSPAAGGLSSDPLHDLTLTNVRDGSTFRLGDLAAGEPVLLETMAIWCTNCRAQMHQVIDAHTMAHFTSVGLDVDPTELPNDLKQYVESQGFDWRFATANAEVATMLRERFGSQVLNPPSTPMILFIPDGSVRALDFGRPGGYSADELVAQISAG